MKKNKEFEENRISWKWFDRRIDDSIKSRVDKDHMTMMMLNLEILKELQHLNNSLDKKQNGHCKNCK